MEASSTKGIVAPDRRGPVEGEGSLGVDRPPERKPGVPMEGSGEVAGDVADRPLPAQREQRERRLHRAALDRPTAVFGTAQPHRGLTGEIRRAAYAIPEHRKRHWMLLLAADRIDVAGDRIGGALAGPLEAAGADDAARRVRERPFLALGVAAAGALLAKRLLR